MPGNTTEVNKEEVLKTIKCNVCGNADPAKFKEAFHKDGLIVYECLVCSFDFVPYYFRKDISYASYKDEKVLDQVRKGNNWLKIQRHLLRYKLIQKYQPSGKLFDLGVGWGHFLHTGRLLGYDVSGIEISDTCFEYSKNDLNLPVEHVDFFKMPLQKEQYDLITMWDVLEHIDDAASVIDRCALMLKKGGYIVIQVPQIDSYIAKKYKDNWKMISLDHVNYFSKKTITKLLQDRGFEVKRIKPSIELKLFLMYTLLPWLRRNKKDNKPKISSAERQEFFNKTTKRPMWQLRVMVFFHDIIYNMLSTMNMGEEMIAVARKK